MNDDSWIQTVNNDLETVWQHKKTHDTIKKFKRTGVAIYWHAKQNKTQVLKSKFEQEVHADDNDYKSPFA